MSGLGGPELLIIAAVVVLLFGPSLVSFWIGFVLGRKTTAEKYESARPQIDQRQRADEDDREQPHESDDTAAQEPHDE